MCYPLFKEHIKVTCRESPTNVCFCMQIIDGALCSFHFRSIHIVSESIRYDLFHYAFTVVGMLSIFCVDIDVQLQSFEICYLAYAYVFLRYRYIEFCQNEIM